MYCKVSNKEEAEKAVNALKELGFTISKYGAQEITDEVKGVATFIAPDELSIEKTYILLYDHMMCTNPHTSWITARKEVKSVDELVEGAKAVLFFYKNKFGNAN